ncbi:MAG: Crp/Fnr family transcriptional regulator [Candidatus Eremiobacteraeota bacterium]|nr:Crp/Fnr family transcriptional regulator [Candidatus Eremiobacteraeota bacterium]
MTDVTGLVQTFGLLSQRSLEAGRGGDARGGGESAPVVENKVWYLRQNRLFEEATGDSVDASEHLFTTCLVPKRTRVFDLGDATRVVFLIKRGKVRVSRLTPDGKEVTVAVLGAGDLFGEETLFTDAPRTTIATCLEETLLCTAKADDLFALLARNPALALNVAKVLSGRLDEASAVLEDVAYAKIPERLMHLFTRLSAEHGTPTGRGVRVDVALTHGDIASLIGSTRETVSLELGNLVAAGKLIADGRRYIIPEPELSS